MKSYTCLFLLFGVTFSEQVILAQNTIPNPTFQSSLTPWTASGGAVSILTVPRAVKLESQGSKTEVQAQGKFFGQGRNVILLRAAGLRDVAPHQATVDLDVRFNIGQGSNLKSVQIPTSGTGATASGPINGPFRDFAWIPAISPGGNGTGTFTVSTSDDVGVVVANVYAFMLLNQNQVPSRGVAGYGELDSGTASLPGNSVFAVTNGLNGNGNGYSTLWPLTLGVYASGFSGIKFDAKLADGGFVQVSLFDFSGGKWIQVSPSSSLGNVSLGAHLGAAFSPFTLANISSPQRFIDPDSAVVLVRLTFRGELTSRGTLPPPAQLTVRNFRLQP